MEKINKYKQKESQDIDIDIHRKRKVLNRLSTKRE
jgi:hypothetical protein